MAFRVVLQPSGHSFEVPPDKTVLLAGLEAGFYMPYSCRVGTCRTCRGTIKSGRVDYGDVHPTYLPDIDKAKGYVLCCQARPLEDTVIEVKELDGMAGLRPRVVPCRVEKVDKPTPDVAVIGVRLPMNENFRFLAGQHIDVQLKDGKRRSYSIANSPKPEGVTTLELHVRHTPGGAFTDQVFSTLKVRDLLRFEGPLGTFYVREDFGQADRDGGERHRLCADQGHVRSGDAEGHETPDRAILGMLDAARPVYGRRSGVLATSQPEIHPGAVEPHAGMRLDRTNGLCAPRRDGGFSGSFRRPGVCLRRPCDGRGRAHRLQREMRPAARGILRRRFSNRSRQGSRIGGNHVANPGNASGRHRRCQE